MALSKELKSYGHFNGKKGIKVFAAFLLIGGIIAAFVLAYQYGVSIGVSNNYYSTTYKDRDIIKTVTIFLGVLLSEVLTATLLYAIVCHLENQEATLEALGRLE